MNIKTINIKSSNSLHSFRRFPYLALSVFFITFLPSSGYSQNQGYDKSADSLAYGPILTNQTRVAGNFGEFRNNHFHSGIDYKTGEKEGLPVFAAADGYISRVKVSMAGYGRAIYITHPDGILTVYGHLRIYYPALEDTVKKQQFSKQEYDLEFFPDSGRFTVQKGMLIGYSGNTGSSEGPHLHFETRNSISETPFNPELHNYPVYDTIPPVISSIAIYTTNSDGNLNGAVSQIIEVNDTTHSRFGSPVVTGKYLFAGFEAFDLAGIEPNKLGIRSYSLFLDDSLVFQIRIDSFSFNETRMVNALIDYPFQREKGRKIMLCHSLKGNKLSFMEGSNGMITLNDTMTHKLHFKVEDSSGNQAETQCLIKNENIEISSSPFTGTPVPYGTPVRLTSRNFNIQTGAHSFYEDCMIATRETTAPSKKKIFYSKILTVTPGDIAVGESVIISLKVHFAETLLPSKLIAVQIDSSGEMQGFNSTYEKGWVTFKTRSLGTFAIIGDTVAPVVQIPSWEKDDYSKQQKLTASLGMDVSGIKSINCFINDTWVPAIYNSRLNRIIINPEDIPESEPVMCVRYEVIDGAGNFLRTDYMVTLAP